MPHLAHATLVVRDYDEALAFYVSKLGFALVEYAPAPRQGKARQGNHLIVNDPPDATQ